MKNLFLTVATSVVMGASMVSFADDTHHDNRSTGQLSAVGDNITGTGVVQQIDHVNKKIKIAHDPIPKLGWPKMVMFFRVKDSALLDQIKDGEKISFELEKAASGYVITRATSQK